MSTNEARAPDVEDLPLWSTRVPNVQEDGTDDPRIVVVEAVDAEDAKQRSALIDCEFVPATEADLDEWEERIDRPLNDRDIVQLLSFIRRAQRELFRRRLKDGPRNPQHQQAARFRARKLAELAGKLETMGGEPDEEDSFGPRLMREVS